MLEKCSDREGYNFVHLALFEACRLYYKWPKLDNFKPLGFWKRSWSKIN
jgi:hypothetical protein